MTDYFLEEIPYISENSNDQLSIENIASGEILGERLSNISEVDKADKDQSSLFIIEQAKQVISYISSTAKSTNEWIIQNDPFKFPVAEASVWDALGKDYDYSREHNYGNDRGEDRNAGRHESFRTKEFNEPFNIDSSSNTKGSAYADNTGRYQAKLGHTNGQDKVEVTATNKDIKVRMEHKNAGGEVKVDKKGGGEVKVFAKVDL